MLLVIKPLSFSTLCLYNVERILGGVSSVSFSWPTMGDSRFILVFLVGESR